MLIAITYDKGEVFQHFGKTSYFKLYEIKEKQIIKTTLLGSNGVGHGALATLLADKKVDTLICGGIGNGALNTLNEANITVISGAIGNTDEVLQQYLAGKLVSTSSNCHHHDNNENHTCGNHSCH